MEPKNHPLKLKDPNWIKEWKGDICQDTPLPSFLQQHKPLSHMHCCSQNTSESVSQSKSTQTLPFHPSPRPPVSCQWGCNDTGEAGCVCVCVIFLVKATLISWNTNVQQDTKMTLKAGISEVCKTPAWHLPALPLLPTRGSSSRGGAHQKKYRWNVQMWRIEKDKRRVFKKRDWIRQ